MVKYDTKNRILHLNKSEEVKLSKREDELLTYLSTGKLVTYDELIKLLGVCDRAFITLRTRFLDKVEYHLNIKVLRNQGLILEDEIYFE